MATSVLSAIQFAQQQAQTDVNGITSVLGLAWANDGLNDFIRELNARRINAAGLSFPVASVMTAGTTQFTWPQSLYALKAIEINYANGVQQDYIKADNVEISNIQNKSFDWLRVNQPTTNPLFANYGATWEAFPTPTQNALVKFVYFATPTEYPDVGTAIGYPLTLDYRALSYWIVQSYKLMLGDYPAADAAKNEYSKRVGKIIDILAPASQQPIQATPLLETGWNL